jgi:hypothetical protein
LVSLQNVFSFFGVFVSVYIYVYMIYVWVHTKSFDLAHLTPIPLTSISSSRSFFYNFFSFFLATFIHLLIRI